MPGIFVKDKVVQGVFGAAGGFFIPSALTMVSFYATWQNLLNDIMRVWGINTMREDWTSFKPLFLKKTYKNLSEKEHSRYWQSFDEQGQKLIKAQKFRVIFIKCK